MRREWGPRRARSVPVAGRGDLFDSRPAPRYPGPGDLGRPIVVCQGASGPGRPTAAPREARILPQSLAAPGCDSAHAHQHADAPATGPPYQPRPGAGCPGPTAAATNRSKAELGERLRRGPGSPAFLGISKSSYEYAGDLHEVTSGRGGRLPRGGLTARRQAPGRAGGAGGQRRDGVRQPYAGFFGRLNALWASRHHRVLPRSYLSGRRPGLQAGRRSGRVARTSPLGRAMRRGLGRLDRWTTGVVDPPGCPGRWVGGQRRDGVPRRTSSSAAAPVPVGEFV